MGEPQDNGGPTAGDHDILSTQQLTDDLKLQAWLARAELPDDRRLRLHLGKMEATDYGHGLEDRWRHLWARLDHALGGEHPLDDLQAVLDEFKESHKGTRRAA